MPRYSPHITPCEENEAYQEVLPSASGLFSPLEDSSSLFSSPTVGRSLPTPYGGGVHSIRRVPATTKIPAAGARPRKRARLLSNEDLDLVQKTAQMVGKSPHSVLADFDAERLGTYRTRNRIHAPSHRQHKRRSAPMTRAAAVAAAVAATTTLSATTMVLSTSSPSPPSRGPDHSNSAPRPHHNHQDNQIHTPILDGSRRFPQPNFRLLSRPRIPTPTTTKTVSPKSSLKNASSQSHQKHDEAAASPCLRAQDRSLQRQIQRDRERQQQSQLQQHAVEARREYRLLCPLSPIPICPLLRPTPRLTRSQTAAVTVM